MGFVDPLAAIIVSICFLGVMLYKRVNLGIALNATALLLALLSLNWQEIPPVIFETTIDLLTISVVLATFVIMLLSQLYKETGLINDLSESLIRIIKNSKIASSILPAVVGLLPVAGGALMSAPLVDLEAEKLGLKPEKKAYVNLWFRHVIFPVYPINQVLILTATLTGVAMPLIIMRQIPVIIVMIIVGYVTSLWKVSIVENKENSNPSKALDSALKSLLVSFSPILATIFMVVGLALAGIGLAEQGLDVLMASFTGLIILIAISKPSLQTFAKPLKGWGIYGITLATYGAFFLRNTMIATGISEIFRTLVTNGNVNIILVLMVLPSVMGVVTGSPSGGVAVSVPILAAILTTFSPKTASLIYMSAFLGYLITPIHLCFAFTADYFRCSLNKVYKYLIPSFLITFTTALLIYFLI